MDNKYEVMYALGVDYINDLLNKTLLKDYINRECGYHEFMESLTDYDCEIASGCCRTVIVPRCENFVIKFEFKRLDRYHYNAGEAAVYRLAKSKGLEKCLAWCELATIDEIEFLIMEKAENTDSYVEDQSARHAYNIYCRDYEDYGHDHPYSYEEYIDSSICYDYAGSDGMLDYCTEVWGWDAVEALTCLLNKAEAYTDDLHSGNFGYIDGNLVIIDYAGYRTQAHD